MNPEKLLKEVDEAFIEYNDTTEIGNYRIEISQDCDPENPRTAWDNLGTMLCFHDRYNLGDEHSYSDVESWVHEVSGLYEDEDTGWLTEEQMDRCWEVAHANHIILPLYLYDHSGITMNTTGFSCSWDSGCVGIIYISLEDVRKEYSWKRVTKNRRARIEKYLENEVEVYDYFLTGAVYGFNIEREDEDGETEFVDSCWGFFGYYTDDDNYMVNEIKSAIKYDIEHTPAQLDLI